MSLPTKNNTLRQVLIWVALGAIIALPIMAAATSPQLAWRDPIYITAGFAGIIAMILLLIQPLAIMNYLPSLTPRQGRQFHGWIGALILLSVAIHVVGLWITSPPDVIDALLFASPTPFSIWGVIAMWGVLITAIVAIYRRKLRPSQWRIVHLVLAIIIISGTIIHALLIEGTMAIWSKWVLSALLIFTVTRILQKYALRQKRN